MKTFKMLPSSTDIRAMNDVQWVFCYMNILKDEEEAEELWKSRAKYHGLFINPDAVKSMTKFEEERKNGLSSSDNHNKNDNVYVNNDFERELQKAMGEDFIEIPDETVVRGNPNMSSDDFINMCLENSEETNSGYDNDDLDIIEVDK